MNLLRGTGLVVALFLTIFLASAWLEESPVSAYENGDSVDVLEQRENDIKDEEEDQKDSIEDHEEKEEADKEVADLEDKREVGSEGGDGEERSDTVLEENADQAGEETDTNAGEQTNSEKNADIVEDVRSTKEGKSALNQFQKENLDPIFPMKKGQSSTAIQEMKRDLARLGVRNWNIKNISPTFGSGTEEAVKDFQRYYGLKVTGIVDEATFNKIKEVLNSPMQKGNSSEAIRELKKNLARLGVRNWNIRNINSSYGDGTEAAIRDFQKQYGLFVNGIADEVTLSKIEELLSLPMEQGKSSPAIQQMKRNLVRIGIADWSIPHVSAKFGSGTEAAVRKFQKYYGLKVTGKVDKKTLLEIEKVLFYSIQKGDKSAEVREMKKNLARIGVRNWNIDNVNSVFGDGTEAAIRDFQKYYGLVVNGLADKVTLRKIDEIINSPMQKGNSSKAIRELKQKLARLGVRNWNINHVSSVFGDGTEAAVRDFQKYYGLLVNGIADEVTLRKIDEIINSPMQRGNSSEAIRKLKQDLVRLGFANWNINHVSPTFGAGTEEAVREFQRRFGLFVNGIADEVTLAKIDELLKNRVIITYTTYNLTFAEALAEQMKRSPQTTTPRGFVHSSYIKNGKVHLSNPNSTLNVRSAPSTSSKVIHQLRHGQPVNVIGKHGEWLDVTFSASGLFHDASEAAVAEYMDPNRHDRFQHLVLTTSAGVSASQLNKLLKGKGALEGMGSAFIEAGRKYSVNEVYLIAHALLETGNGTSQLANGVKVGLNKKGEPELVTEKNKDKLTNIKTVYNMFGIGAYDGSAVESGAIYAYNKGWDTPKKAIVGGAEFISSSYFARGQNTLYKMRWNHAYPSSWGYPQYATDIGWAVKQVPRIKELYEQLKNPILHFDIVRYLK